MELQLLTARDIAEILKISYGNALLFIRYSGIPYIQVGRQYRVEEEQLTAFLKEPIKRIIPLEEEVDVILNRKNNWRNR